MPPNQPYPPYPNLPPQGKLPSAHDRKPWKLVLSLVLFILLTIGASSFGLWAYASRQVYKDKSDQQTAKAVAVAVQQESTKKDNEFVEKEKNPLKSYQASEAYGSLSVSYPKTWSAYVLETDKSNTPIDGYFHPNFVPGAQSGAAFALRVQILNTPYDQVLKQFDSVVKTGKVKVAPFVAKNVPSITGARLDGEITTGHKDTMILLPLRDKTIKIYSESQQFATDFDTFVLPNLKFIP